MEVKLKLVETKKDLKKFVKLPFEIYKNSKLWVPPLYSSQKKFFNRKRNKSFSFSDTLMVLALRDDKVVGRIMGIINRKFNEYKNEKTARFTFFDCYEDKEVAALLLNYIEKWALEKGMQKVMGPTGFSVREPAGFLVEGYEYEPAFGSIYNFPYMVRFLEELGYRKDIDYVSYKIPVRETDAADRFLKRIESSGNFKVVEVKKRKEMKKYFIPVMKLMNESFINSYNYYPLEDDEMISYAKSHLTYLDPRFSKIIVNGDVISAFVVGIPNMNVGIRSANGRLFPLGWWHIKKAKKKAKQLDVLFIAVGNEFRERGLELMLTMAMNNSALKAGYEFVDGSFELETNRLIRSYTEKIGGKLFKRYRIFTKQLL